MQAPRDAQTYEIIGAAMEVHRHLGCGFLEAVYRAAMLEELHLRQVPCRQEVLFKIPYKGRVLPLRYRADLVCFELVIVEIKACVGLRSVDQAQAINYLKVSKLRRALVLNFGVRSLEYQRVVL